MGKPYDDGGVIHSFCYRTLRRFDIPNFMSKVSAHTVMHRVDLVTEFSTMGLHLPRDNIQNLVSTPNLGQYEFLKAVKD